MLDFFKRLWRDDARAINYYLISIVGEGLLDAFLEPRLYQCRSTVVIPNAVHLRSHKETVLDFSGTGLDREKIVVPYGMKLFDEWVVPEGGTRTVADDAEHAETVSG
jgi:hypothetical protein